MGDLGLIDDPQSACSSFRLRKFTPFDELVYQDREYEVKWTFHVLKRILFSSYI